ncbi:hypothetical protein U1Q18_012891 [Sarracenia purpurea var. burkii]
MEDVRTWLSASMTDEDTCLDGFEGEEEGEEVQMLRNKLHPTQPTVPPTQLTVFPTQPPISPTQSIVHPIQSPTSSSNASTAPATPNLILLVYVPVTNAPATAPNAPAELRLRIRFLFGSSTFDLADLRLHSSVCGLNMGGKYIIASLVGTFAIAYVVDHLIADKKMFGGTTPKTVSSKEWWEETDKKFQAWPRTAGPPVVMNPISRQNFIVKAHVES